MKVRNKVIRKENLILIDVKDTLETAIEKLETENFLSLPVVDGDEFKGVIFSDMIYKSYFKNDYKDKEDFLKNNKVEDFYIEKTEFVSECQGLEEATLMLLKKKKTFLPVFDRYKKFIGILTHNSIFEYFFEISGQNNKNKIVVLLYNMPGQIAKLTALSKGLDVNILSIITEDVQVMGYYKVIMTLEGEDIEAFKEKIETSGFKILN